MHKMVKTYSNMCVIINLNQKYLLKLLYFTDHKAHPSIRRTVNKLL